MFLQVSGPVWLFARWSLRSFALAIRGKVLPWWLSDKESFCQCRRCGFSPWVRKIPWRRKWQPTLVSLSGKSHGERSLAGYSPWGCKRVGHDLATKTQQPTTFEAKADKADVSPEYVWFASTINQSFNIAISICWTLCYILFSFNSQSQ